jgi:hypothetical protein
MAMATASLQRNKTRIGQLALRYGLSLSREQFRHQLAATIAENDGRTLVDSDHAPNRKAGNQTRSVLRVAPIASIWSWNCRMFLSRPS